MDQRCERRLCRRCPLPIALRFHVLDLDSDISEQVVECANISRRGVYFTSDLALPVGRKIFMTLRMPVEICGFEDAEIRCVGRVVRKEMLWDRRTGYGVEIGCMGSIRTHEQDQGTFATVT
jgi:hypothetical protein